MEPVELDLLNNYAPPKPGIYRFELADKPPIYRRWADGFWGSGYYDLKTTISTGRERVGHFYVERALRKGSLVFFECELDGSVSLSRPAQTQLDLFE